MAKDTIEDRVLAFAQTHLTDRMAKCKRCGRFYFRKYKPQVRKAQKYCPGKCALKAKRALNRNWYHDTRKELFKQELEKAGMKAHNIEELFNGEIVSI